MLRNSVRFDVATAAIKGGREHQEDNLIASFPQGQETGFAVLADGMGGHLSGDVASALVMTEVFSKIKLQEMVLDKTITDISNLLHSTATAANDRIKQHIAQQPDTYGMGSTLLATVICGDALYWVSVGDSPLFLFRDGELRQLNQDHSMAPQIDMLVKVGAMDPEIGRNHPDRNTLTSAIAGVKIEKIDCPDTPTTVLPGDIIILASDGLQFLSNDQIAAILLETQAAHSGDISNALLTAIAELDDIDQDNTVFTVIKLGERQQVTQPATADAASMPVQLRCDLAVTTPAQEEIAAQPEPVVGTTPEAHDPNDIPAMRVIRLMTSKSLSFEKPAAPNHDAATVEKIKPQGLGGWYRRQRTSND